MGRQRTAPPGYDSNYAALFDLVRFAPGLWGQAKSLALLFHAERSILYGKESDQHSQAQVTQGVWSKRSETWIRGPSGLSRATLNRVNVKLERLGLIRRHPRFTGRGGYAATEFEVKWLAIRAAIQEWKEVTAAPSLKRKKGAPLAHSEPRGGGGGLSHGETGACLMVRQGLSHGETRGGPQVVQINDFGEAQNDSDLVSKDLYSESRAREAADPPAAATELTHSTSVLEVTAALEAAYGALLPADPIPGELLSIADRLYLPVRSLCRWVYQFAEEKRRKGYTITSPRLFVTAATAGDGRDLIAWMKKNADSIAAEVRKLEVDRQRDVAPAALAEMPAHAICPNCKQELLPDGKCHSETCNSNRAPDSSAAGAGGGPGGAVQTQRRANEG